MSPLLTLFFQVIITLIAISGIAVFIYGWWIHGRDAPLVLIGVLSLILQWSLKIPMNVPEGWKAGKKTQDEVPPTEEGEKVS